MQTDFEQEDQDDVSSIGLSSRDILVMEEERHRLARELHDGPLQALTVMSIHVEVCKQLSLNKDVPTLQHELSQLELDFQKTITEIRDLMREWRMPSSNDDSLRALIDGYVRKYETRTGVEVSLELSDLPDNALRKEQKVAIFRILQEALRNTSRHAEASHIWIELRVRGTNLQLAITDNGKGFNLLGASTAYPRRGLGLVGMQERAKALGGRLQVDSQPGRGTEILLVVPDLWGDADHASPKAEEA